MSDRSSTLLDIVKSNDKAAIISALSAIDSIDFSNDRGFTALHLAAEHGNSEAVSILLEAGADPNILNNHGNSPLWTATFNARGDYSIVQLLMNFGGDPTHKNKAGRSPMDFARQIDDSSLISILMQRG